MKSLSGYYHSLRIVQLLLGVLIMCLTRYVQAVKSDNRSRNDQPAFYTSHRSLYHTIWINQRLSKVSGCQINFSRGPFLWTGLNSILPSFVRVFPWISHPSVLKVKATVPILASNKPLLFTTREGWISTAATVYFLAEESKFLGAFCGSPHIQSKVSISSYLLATNLTCIARVVSSPAPPHTHTKLV